MIFGINTTSDISKLLYVISRAVRRVKFETILKHRKWYLCQISRTNHAIRELKQRRRRRQQERQKNNWFRLANNNFARVSRFFVHSFAVTALLRRENAYFHVL